LAGRYIHGRLAAEAGLRVTGVVTRDPGRRTQAAGDWPGARLFNDVTELLAARDAYDLVVVASPTGLHATQAATLARAGVPFVLDKPIGVDAHEARAVVAEAAATGTPFTVFQNRRWDPEQLTLTALLERGELGDVHTFERRWERWRPVPRQRWKENDPAAGGLLLDLGPHLVDSATQLFGRVESVWAQTRALTTPTEDDVFLVLQHEAGGRLAASPHGGGGRRRGGGGGAGRGPAARPGGGAAPGAGPPGAPAAAENTVADALATAVERSAPFFLLVEKGTFADGAKVKADTPDLPSREDALIAAATAVGDDAAIVSTTGMLSRELFEYRRREGQDGDRDFLTVGGMGHASSIALGVAMAEPEREVWCFDGDGALLMHMGTLAVIADHGPRTFFHIVFNNGVHDSVGGQPTSIGQVDVAKAALASGYRYAASTGDLDSLAEEIARMRDAGGPALLELTVKPGNRKDIGRPTRTPAEAKAAFMAALRK
jgi:predicted dehydrogenase